MGNSEMKSPSYFVVKEYDCFDCNGKRRVKITGTRVSVVCSQCDGTGRLQINAAIDDLLIAMGRDWIIQRLDDLEIHKGRGCGPARKGE